MSASFSLALALLNIFSDNFSTFYSGANDWTTSQRQGRQEFYA
jgi:hypothetical protein